MADSFFPMGACREAEPGPRRIRPALWLREILRSEDSAQDEDSRCSSSIQIDVVQLRCILADDLMGHAFRHALEILLDYLKRIRPGRIGMREVRGPHEVILAEVVEQHRADRIVLEGR